MQKYKYPQVRSVVQKHAEAVLPRSDKGVFYRLYPYTIHRENNQSNLARTTLFHIRYKITVFPDMVRFALLYRSLFFALSMEAVVKRLGGKMTWG